MLSRTGDDALGITEFVPLVDDVVAMFAVHFRVDQRRGPSDGEVVHALQVRNRPPT